MGNLLFLLLQWTLDLRKISTCKFTYTVKLGNKERFDKEQIGIKEPFPVTNLPFNVCPIKIRSKHSSADVTSY